jgi:hypothetical protein
MYYFKYGGEEESMRMVQQYHSRQPGVLHQETKDLIPKAIPCGDSLRGYQGDRG